jgi:hypothetical protein
MREPVGSDTDVEVVLLSLSVRDSGMGFEF